MHRRAEDGEDEIGDEGAGDGRGRELLSPESAPCMQPGGEIGRPTPFSAVRSGGGGLHTRFVELTPETRVETVAAGAGDNVHNVHNMGQGAAGGQADVHTGSNQISVAARCAIISCAEN